MRNISFSITLDAFLSGQKDVTRRVIHSDRKSVWRNLKPGDHLMGVEKAQGLKKGEKIKQIGEIRIIHTELEPLNRIITIPKRGGPGALSPLSEVEREGFPLATPEQFVAMFCKFNRCDGYQIVNRIVFERVV